MSQRFYSDPVNYAVRLPQFSNPDITHNGVPTGNVSTADNARTLRNLISGTAAFRSRPERIFLNGFDGPLCPAITY